MTKVTQKGDAGYIHRIFHGLAKKYKVNVDKVAQIIDDWEGLPKTQHNAILKQIKNQKD